MRRRQFLIGSAALGWPLFARAQRSIPIVGFLNIGSPDERAHLAEAFRGGLKEGGYVEGKNVAIEYRWGEGNPDLMPKLAAELVERKVAVIAATGSFAPVLAAKTATKTIPIVFSGGGDPVRSGLVKSLNHPGGNITGVMTGSEVLSRKRLEVFKDLMPGARKIAYLSNPKNADGPVATYDLLAAAEAIRIHVEMIHAANENEIDNAFAAIKQLGADGLVVSADPLFLTRRQQVISLAARNAIPASYPFREFPMAGGLMSYGTDIREAYRQAGAYTARVLSGARPADLPVVQVNRIELVVNFKTAKALGLSFPRDFLARVDEVIQ